ncbi:MAG: hypothetical protein LAP21_15160 [Acidobacteriia bacterium]|nr:hypothetical protein [Terriglobia bacterium]
MELNLIDLGLGLLKQLTSSVTKAQWPAKVIDALSTSISALEEHRNDVVSKAALESQRG